MRKTIRMFILGLITIIGLSSVAFGGVISKTFEIGVGTGQSYSHKRTFEVPCGTAITALVTYSRMGKSGVENDVPLTITLMRPAADGSEGEVSDTKQVTATNVAINSTTLGAGRLSSTFGCDKTWSVRVKADESKSGFTVKGEIRFTFNDDLRTLIFSGVTSLSNNQTEDFDINVGRQQGIVNIKGEWFHNLGVMPIKMRAELVSPSGEVVALDDGYPQNEVNPCCSGQKLKILYRIPEYIEGNWKIRLKNLSTHDAVRIKLIGTFKPDCP